MNRLRPILKNLLLTFVLISIGFVLGKHSVRQTGLPPGMAPSPAQAEKARQTVTVFYMHATIRCVTCNTIEKMTRDLLESQFSTELAEGILVWRDVDFQKNEALAGQFAVVSSCVVVARMEGNTVADFKRLDEVWTLMDDPPAFNTYIADAIQFLLAQADPGGVS